MAIAHTDMGMYYSGMTESRFHGQVEVHSCGAGEHDSDWSWQTDGSVRYCAFSVLLIGEGLCRVELADGASVLAGAGDMLLLRWDSPRVESNAGGSVLVAPWCSFDWCDPSWQANQRERAPQLDRRHMLDPDFALACMQRVVEANILGRTDEAAMYLSALLAEFSRGAQHKHTTQQQWPQRIRRLCRRIQNDPGQPWSVVAMAEAHQCDPDHFARVFRRIIGEAPGRYVIRCRIERASVLLRHSNETVAAIADALGYCDPYAFSKQFKKFSGHSPSTFRTMGQA